MRLLATSLLFAVAFCAVRPALAENDWPQFRGPSGQGIATAANLPTDLAEGSASMKWKTPLPGKAWSSPVVAGDQVWLTNATEDGRELFVITLDKATGKILRNQKVFDVEAPQFCIPFNSYASPTPAIDVEGGKIFIVFGSPGVACLDLKTGAKIWERRDFVCNHFRGAGSSPLLYKNLMILPFDGSDFQFIVAIDKATGKDVWRTARSVDFDDLDPKTGKPKTDGDFRKAFSTPRIMTVNGKPQLISTGSKATYAYDPETGKEIWRVEHKKQHTGALTPIIGKDLVYIGTGHGKCELWAIDPTGVGVLGAANIKWKLTTNVPTRATPILVDDLLYMADDAGVASCLDAATGKEVWKQRIKGQFSAAPILADGKILFVSEGGFITFIEPGRTFKLVAESRIPSGFMAVPAITGNAIILRSKTDVYKFEK